ncbi:fascin domain-containing protein [Streptomyces mayteni]
MRRQIAVIASVCGLLAASALGASTTATAASPAAAPAAASAVVPEGWERIGSEAELAEVLAGSTLEAPAGQAESGFAAQDVYVEERLAIESVRNWNFVTTEINYAAPNTGVTRARSGGVFGAWEEFDFVWDDTNGTFAMRSRANNLYVAVEKNFTGERQNMLRARSASVGGWERFELYQDEETLEFAILSMLNGQWVAMENNYTGALQYTLRARSAEPAGSWEAFNIYQVID